MAAVFTLLALATGSIDQSDSTLVVMGFDPDRAQLITSLVIGGIAASLAVVATDKFGQAVWLGLAVFGTLFGATFVAETGAAQQANGSNGSFDPGGWLLSLLTLFVIGGVAAWAGAALGGSLRPSLLDAGRAVVATVRSVTSERRADWRAARKPVALALVLALLVVTVPVFGDMVNMSPDARMLDGGPAPQRLVAADSGSLPPTDAPAASDPPSASASMSDGPSGTPGSDQRPWLAWRPTGRGKIVSATLPAPWAGGAVEQIMVYLPPGYDAGSLRYPVIYETGQQPPLWTSAANTRTSMDTMIDAGTIPATVMAFASLWGGPYNDSACANSFDRKELMDTFMAVTLPKWVDSHYRTIARPAARATIGMSESGYCAPMLALRHPDEFGAAISFSGYYAAGVGNPTSWMPFNHDPALISAYSSDALAAKLPASRRDGLYFVFSAKPDQPFYGSQAATFDGVLTREGYEHVYIKSTLPHGWGQVRAEYGTALKLWAARLAATGALS